MGFLINANEDPRQRDMRLRQQQMQGLSEGLDRMPTNMGQGLQAVGDALMFRNLQSQQQAAAADPWSSMREPTRTGIFDLGKGFPSLASLWGT